MKRMTLTCSEEDYATITALPSVDVEDEETIEEAEELDPDDDIADEDEEGEPV